MTSQMHQLMSQQHQVVETTPGHSKMLFQPLRLLIQQRKVEAHTKGITGNTMTGKSLLWAPC